jgi:hypothetical protein
MRISPLALVFTFGCTAHAPAPPANSTPRAPDVVLDVVSSNEDTGTMHYAERVVVRWGDALPLVVETDVERGTLAPLFGRVVPLANDRVALIGSSSWGGGEWTQHAWVIARERGAVRVVEATDASAPRGERALDVDAWLVARGGR